MPTPAPPPHLSRTLLIGGSAALLAAATALWVGRRAQRAEREHPPVGRFVEVDGVHLHYVERGEGPPVVLLHGNSVLLQDFAASGLFDALAARHRVLAFDRPGYGFSTRPADRHWSAAAQAALLAEAMTRLGVAHAVVLGHSWGTLVALELALEAPDRVDGLVLVSGYYHPTLRLDAAAVAPAAMPVIGGAIRHTIAPVAGRLSLKAQLRTMFAPRPVSPRFLALQPRELLLRPSQLRANAEDGASMVAAAAAIDRRLASLRPPVRIVAGAGDAVVDPEAHSRRLHRDLPGSELLWLPDAGHMVHYAEPERIAALVDGVSGDTWTDHDRLRTPSHSASDTNLRASPASR